MKNLNYISALLCVAALTATGCSNEEIIESGTPTGEFTLTATTGASTKTTVNDLAIEWSDGDKIYVFGTAVAGQDKVYKATGTLDLKSKNGTTGTFGGTITGAKTDLEYAVYGNYTPATMSVAFPTTYTYPDSNAPMFGELTADKSKIEFNQLLSGMMRIKLNGEATSVTGSLTLTASGIEGSAPLTISTDGAASLGDFTSGNANAVTVSFENATYPLVLDVPVPAATYADGITAKLTIGTAEAQVYNTTKDFVISAGMIKEMPEISNIEINADNTISFTRIVDNVDAANKALADGEKGVTITEVKTGDEIIIPSTTESTLDSPVVINISSIDADAAITVKGDKTDASTTSVQINTPTGSTGTLTIKDLNHVEISGEWATVNSSTGDNTLVVKAAAVINNLIVNKGNVRVEGDGKIAAITNSTGGTVYLYQEDKAAQLPTITAEQNIVVMLESLDLLPYGGTAILSADETREKGLYLSKNNIQSILELKNNAKFSVTQHLRSIGVVNGASLTIQGSGTIENFPNSSNDGALYVARRNTTDAETNLTIKGDINVISHGGNRTGTVHAAVFIAGGTVTIEGGYFYSSNDAAGVCNPCLFTKVQKASCPSTILIRGGVFDSEACPNNYLLNVQDADRANCHITISGGTFVGFNPADHTDEMTIAEGYESVKTTYNNKEAWTVQAKQ